MKKVALFLSFCLLSFPLTQANETGYKKDMSVLAKISIKNITLLK